MAKYLSASVMVRVLAAQLEGALERRLQDAEPITHTATAAQRLCGVLPLDICAVKLYRECSIKI